jgi:hypothetical protein
VSVHIYTSRNSFESDKRMINVCLLFVPPKAFDTIYLSILLFFLSSSFPQFHASILTSTNRRIHPFCLSVLPTVCLYIYLCRERLRAITTDFEFLCQTMFSDTALVFFRFPCGNDSSVSNWLHCAWLQLDGHLSVHSRTLSYSTKVWKLPVANIKLTLFEQHFKGFR